MAVKFNVCKQLGHNRRVSPLALRKDSMKGHKRKLIGMKLIKQLYFILQVQERNEDDTSSSKLSLIIMFNLWIACFDGYCLSNYWINFNYHIYNKIRAMV